MRILGPKTGDEAFAHFLRVLVRRRQGEAVTTDTVEALCAELFPHLEVEEFFDVHLRGVAEYRWDETHGEMRLRE
jgi:hypothetical protein